MIHALFFATTFKGRFDFQAKVFYAQKILAWN